MAQSGSIEVEVEANVKFLVDVDVTRIRRRTKRIIEECKQLNRELAELQERLDTLGGRLCEYGIDLEVYG